MDPLSPAPSSSLFDKLPLELLKLIVSFVNDQDKRFNESEIQTSTQPDRYDYCDEEEPARGIFSSRYRHGIKSLSLCNKLFRSLCLPWLVETVTPRKISGAFAQVFVLGAPLSHYIRHLDISESYAFDLLAACAALPRLPRLDRITIAARTMPSFMRDGWTPPDMARDDRSTDSQSVFANLALRRFLPRLKDVTLQVDSVDSVEELCGALRYLDQAALRKLRIDSDTEFFRYDSAPTLPLLQHFPLESLVLRHKPSRINDTLPAVISDGWEALRMPTVTSLSITLTNDPDAAFRFIQSAFPNLVTFEVHHSGLVPHEIDPLDNLPSLKQFIYHGDTITSDILSYFTNTPLITATYCHHDAPEFTFKYADFHALDYPLPPSLRLVRIEYTTLNQVPDADVLADQLSALGIALTTSWTPTRNLELFEHYGGAGEELGEAFDNNQQAAAVEDTLAWAQRRFEWLKRTGDESGLDEMAAMLRGVRERQVVETL
ncbi:hypothetical protein JCM10207_006472 [Rhodosporidiobolus poonsookiae]